MADLAPNTEALAKLHDIHYPATVSWWPPAPGWYLLFLLASLAFFFLLKVSLQTYHRGKAKRIALKLLKTYEQNYQKDKDTVLTSAKISELLRRVAMAYFPRKNVAGLSGDEWIHFLNQTSKNIDFKPVREYLLTLPYQAQSQLPLTPLFSRAKTWISQRRTLCLS